MLCREEWFGSRIAADKADFSALTCSCLGRDWEAVNIGNIMEWETMICFGSSDNESIFVFSCFAGSSSRFGAGGERVVVVVSQNTSNCGFTAADFISNCMHSPIILCKCEALHDLYISKVFVPRKGDVVAHMVDAQMRLNCYGARTFYGGIL